jgi:hypothetical protein
MDRNDRPLSICTCIQVFPKKYLPEFQRYVVLNPVKVMVMQQ